MPGARCAYTSDARVAGDPDGPAEVALLEAEEDGRGLGLSPSRDVGGRSCEDRGRTARAAATRGEVGSEPRQRRSAIDDDRTLEVLRDIASGFDSHDVERIMRHFAADAVFEAPRGPERWGERFEGHAAISGAFRARFDGIPDVRYRDDAHFAAGNRGASEWTLTGSTREGVRLDVRGCDLWTLRDGLVVRKDSYWKLRTGPGPPSLGERTRRH